MIKDTNKMVGLDCRKIHHCTCNIDDIDFLGMVTPIYLDDSGNEIAGESIEITRSSIKAIKAALLGIKNKENRKSFIDKFNSDIDKQIKLRADIGISAARYQADSALRGQFITYQEAFSRMKGLFPITIA